MGMLMHRTWLEQQGKLKEQEKKSIKTAVDEEPVAEEKTETPPKRAGRRKAIK